MGSLFNACLKNIPTFQQETANPLLTKLSTITIFYVTHGNVIHCIYTLLGKHI